MAAMKGKGPGDKVVKKAAKRASTIGATDMLTRGIGGPIGTEVGSFAQASKQKKPKRK